MRNLSPEPEFKQGSSGATGGYKEPPLLVLVTSPPTQPCWGRLRDAITDRPLLLNTTTCLSRRTDRISPAQWESVPDCFGTKSLHTPPGHGPRGGHGAVGERQLCCSATSHPRSAWLGGQHSFPTPWCTGHRVDNVSNSSSSMVEKSGVDCLGENHKRMGISGKPTSSHCFS